MLVVRISIFGQISFIIPSRSTQPQQKLNFKHASF